METQGRPRTGKTAAIAAAMLLLAAACRPAAPPALEAMEAVPLPGEDFTFLHLAEDAEVWLGAPGRVVRLDADGRVIAELLLPDGSEPLEFVGRHEALAYFRTGSTLIAVDVESFELAAEPAGLEDGELALDVRGRYLFHTTGAGSVIAHGPRHLEPLWGWGAAGAPASAMALSPEGDRLYLALAERPGERAAEILVRDLQTGRVLSRTEVVEPVRALATDPRGDLYALAGEPRGNGTVIALRYRRGELETQWRRPLPEVDTASPTRLLVSPGGGWLAVLSAGDRSVLHLLETRSGQVIGRFDRSFRDAAFGPHGELWVLLPGERWRVE